MIDQICSEALILNSQVIASQVRYEDPSDGDPHQSDYSSDDERPADPKLILDRLEALSADGRACFPHRRRDALTGTSHGGSISLTTNKSNHVARSKVAHRQHDPVKDDKQWQNS